MPQLIHAAAHLSADLRTRQEEFPTRPTGAQTPPDVQKASSGCRSCDKCVGAALSASITLELSPPEATRESGRRGSAGPAASCKVMVSRPRGPSL